MAEFPLNILQRRQLIEHLARYGRIRTHIERDAFLADSGLTEALGNLRYDLSLEGAEREFAHALITVCQRRGTLADIQRPALVLVLWHLQEIASGQEEVVNFVE